LQFWKVAQGALEHLESALRKPLFHVRREGEGHDGIRP
jgi:hypothetical protein